MNWKTAYRSFYYATAEEPADIQLDPASAALLVIDVQNIYLAPKDTPEETARWQPFYDRMRQTVIPNIARLIADCRARGVEVHLCADRLPQAATVATGRSARRSRASTTCSFRRTCRTARSSTELAPQGDDITVLKTTDSALTGTNLG